MPELLIELLTEEIPARMQASGAEGFSRLVSSRLAPLLEEPPNPFHGPRRIGLVARLRPSVSTEAKEERGPRVGAPEQALAGFLKKHSATREMLTEQSGFLVLVKPGETFTARELVARISPDLLAGMSWPRYMRWEESGFEWIRPLRRLLWLLDGEVIRFDLISNDGKPVQGLATDNLTEGHRVQAPGAFAVTGYADYVAKLRERFVIVDAAERAALIEGGVAALAAAEGLEVVPDAGLLAEVAGLVEWPVPLLGRIDDAFMDLPPEVMRTSMRVNQRYFSLRYPDGRAAPFFALVANISASDGGAALVAGNERVLRARLSDARFFWDQDRKQRLEDFLPKLEGVVFHAKLGTQAQRVERIAKLAEYLAPMLSDDPELPALAKRAAELAKADLASGMVGEFPELQGVMGGYYARAQGEDARVADAIAQHYRPLGPTDAVPTEPVAIAVALSDKLDQLAGFFVVDERPTGSADPYALRRAALGVIRFVRDKGLALRLLEILREATYSADESAKAAFYGSDQMNRVRLETYEFLKQQGLSRLQIERQIEDKKLAEWLQFRAAWPPVRGVANLVLDFLTDRLRAQLRAEGARHDLVTASIGEDDDILRILARADALKALVESEDGTNLLAAYKRAQNILRIEEKKDGPHSDPVDAALLTLPAEQALNAALETVEPDVAASLAHENFTAAMASLAALRPPVDAFFEHILVNDPDPSLRRNRLRLLSRLKVAMDQVADLSKIES